MTQRLLQAVTVLCLDTQAGVRREDSVSITQQLSNPQALDQAAASTRFQDPGVHRGAADSALGSPCSASDIPWMAQTQKCTWVFKLDSDRWMTATTPIFAETLSSSTSTRQWRSRHCSTTRRQMRSAVFSAGFISCNTAVERLGDTRQASGATGAPASARIAAALERKIATGPACNILQGHMPGPAL